MGTDAERLGWTPPDGEIVGKITRGEHPTVIVAEIGNVHDGSLGECHAYIEAVAAAGVDAVKFQCHIAAAESTAAEEWPQRFRFHPQDRTRTDYWRRMEFRHDQWLALVATAHRHGLEFIVSPFSVEAVRRMEQLVDRWKIASGEVNNEALLHAIAATGKPVVLSTGMSGYGEIGVALKILGPDITVLQCTTEYPTPPQRVGLNNVEQFCRNICFRGGLSDHSGTIYPSIIAAYLGAVMVEVHVCWDKRQFHPDVPASVTMNELRQLVEGVRYAEQLRRHPTDKEAIRHELTDVAAYRIGKRREQTDPYHAMRD